VVGVENATDVLQALTHVKDDFHVMPRLAVSDFSPNMINPICQTWGKDVLQIDGYHVMQELNNGIRADLARFREDMYRVQIREFYTLRDCITELQGTGDPSGLYSPDQIVLLKARAFSYPLSDLCGQIMRDFLMCIEIMIPEEFLNAVKDFLTTWQGSLAIPIREFCESLGVLIPKRALTAKGAERMKAKGLQFLKTLFIAYRKTLEEESIGFFHHQWVLFFQPEDLNPERTLLLNNFLTEYPALEEYRQLTLQIGSIYRKPIDTIDGSEISTLQVKTTYTEKLQTALRTIQAYQAAILRFVSVFKDDPSLAKACRANMEPFNRRFKAPFNKGLNCTKKDHLIGKLELQLGCEIRWKIDAPSVI
jgi:hypothetical protein